MLIDIVGIHIEVSCDNSYIYDRFEPFISDFEEDVDLRVCISSSRHIHRPKGTLILDEDLKWSVNPADSKGITVYLYGRESGDIICRLDVDDYWSKADISYLENRPNIEYTVASFLGNILIRNRILLHCGIVVHASAVEWQGRGILFSAPSGTGKSTQASLWESYLGATVLNDDCPAISVLDDIPHVYGTPWSGSTKKFINGCADLSAIVILEQAPENKLQRLEANKAVSLLMPRCFLPYHDDSLMSMAIGHVEKIIAAVPVYLLKCRPDREAVELVYQCVK